MPTIAVDKAQLYEELGREYTTEEFDELCFEFGIELDEDTTDQERPIVDGVQEPPELKIEIPANRYDMLCLEGIALNLNVFLQRQELPKFSLKPPKDGELLTMNVKEATAKIRPLVSCAVLRNIKFTKDRYNSFIELQEKLHQNLARQRTLVSIGTHDLNTIQGPFTYDALPPEKINFAPLNQEKSMNGKELMEFYEKDRHLNKFLPIIRDSPVYPIIYDSKGQVLSLPPIINSNHSKITLNTTDVFIEITATDKTKVEIVNCIVVAMFSRYCAEPFTVEPVQVNSPHNGETRQTPDLSPRQTQASVSYINGCCDLSLSPAEICNRLKRMGYTATPSKADPDVLDIAVPPTRADVLQQCDIMEDAAIAYGFNNLPRTFPSKAATIAAPLPINRVSDIVRLEAAQAGWTEVLPLILCSHDENFAWLNRKDDGRTAVRLQNPKSAEYQIVRTTLVSGLLKCFRENKRHGLPMKVFEASDVVLKDPSAERKSRNERRFAAAWCGKSSGFEMVHGLLDRLMLMLKCRDLNQEKEEEKKAQPDLLRYWIEEVDSPTFLDGHAASINLLHPDGKKQVIGVFGILHPTVLRNFELNFPVSTLEFNLEVFI